MPSREDLAVLRFQKPTQGGKRVRSGSVELEHSPRDRSVVGVDLNRAQQFVVSVAERWPARVDALRCLFAHALAYFIPQVLDVVPCDDKLNAVNEFGLRFRVLADDLALFGKMDFNVEVLY